jgi:predicted ATPase
MPPPALVQRSDALHFCERLLCLPQQGGGDHGAVGVLEGAAGIGKSALLDAACAMAGERGMKVLRATGSEFESDFAYGVVRQLFDPLLPHAGRPSRRGPLAGPLRVAAGALGLAADGGEAEHAVRHALVRILAEHGTDAPILIAIDDVELSDQESLDFLRYLAQRQAQHRAVTIVALNPGGCHPPPISLLHLQQRAQVMRLEPLDADGVADLLASRGRPAPPALCVELARVTGGNPFLLDTVSGSFRPEDPEAAPPEVTRHLALRLARLPDETQAIVRTAAVLGDGGSVAIAARATDVRPAVALDAIDSLAEAGVLRRSGTIAFSAPLLRSALY